MVNRESGILRTVAALIDLFFFLFAGAASIWLVWLIFADTNRSPWAWILFFILLWGALAYFLLPRLHRLFTAIYVPNYFIGRSRTGEGLLGDPVNLAFNGTEDDIHRIMQAAGWTLADPLGLRSSLGIVASTLARKSYDAAPVSTLKLFDSMQDFAYQQEVDGSPSKRHHIRFWKCPDDWPLPGGSRHVQWMAAASYDRAVGLSLFTLQVTHKIGADIDKERDHVVDTLKAVDPGLHVEYLKDFSTAYHSVNGGGDAIETDGTLPIVAVENLPEQLPQPTFNAAQIARTRGSNEDQATQVELARIPRPPALYGALCLIGLQLISTLVFLWEVLVNRDKLAVLFDPEAQEIMGSADFDGHDILTIVVVTVIVIAVIRVALAWAMWAGYGGARTTLMVFEGITVINSFVQWYQLKEAITVDTTLVPVAIAIVLLLLLSSSAVGDFAAQKRKWRQDRKDAKHEHHAAP